MSKLVLECKDLSKSFIDGKNELRILTSINLQIQRGEQVAIMGRSGSGKTTLLQLLAGLDSPTSGSVTVLGQNLANLDPAACGLLRNRSVGFIYQLHHLLPEFSALENIALPLLIAGLDPAKAKEKAQALLAEVGLSERSTHRPGQLSGGERQRIAIARAIANNPDLVLADEPTGNLDAENAELIFELMRRLHKEREISFVVVTHDQDLASKLDRTYFLRNGELV